MNTKNFKKLVKDRNTKSNAVLDVKANTYMKDRQGDRLHNFLCVAEFNRVTPQEALWGMVSKHIVALIDVVKSKRVPTPNFVDEYVGDIHNYLYLLEAIWEDQRTALADLGCQAVPTNTISRKEEPHKGIPYTQIDLPAKD